MSQRSAVILPQKIDLRVPYLDSYVSEEESLVNQIEEIPFGGEYGVDYGYVLPLLLQKLRNFCKDVQGPILYACTSLKPHTDESYGEYTLGIVVAGSGILFTGNGRNVGLLEKGSIYLLHNKKTHGLKKHNGPMVFVGIDFRADHFNDVLRWSELALLETKKSEIYLREKEVL